MATRTATPVQGDAAGHLSAHGHRVVATVLAGLALVVGVLAITFLFVPPLPGVAGPQVTVLEAVSIGTLLVVTPLLGLLLVRRVPGNPIGSLFVLMSLGLAAGFWADGVARHLPPSAPVDGLVVFVSAAGTLGFLSLFLLLQLFPTGRLPSRGWRWLPATVIVGGGVANFAANLFAAQPFTPAIPGFVDPFAIASLAPVVAIAGTVSSLTLVVALVATIALLVVRFRHAGDIERQQLKWFAWAASVIALLFILAVATTPLGAVSDTVWSIALASLILLPVAATVAILRYGLFEIDRIVSRTIGYVVVTAILAAAFYGAVAAIQALLAATIERTTWGSLGVAVSTLLVAALFQPVRSRVQRRVDRLFNRRRLDADETARRHAHGLRDVRDVARISDCTQRTVVDTLAPAFAEVWVRDIGGRRSRDVR